MPLLLALVLALPTAHGEQASEPSSPFAAQLDAGGSHTCAVNAGAVRCWGLGFSGQLGYGNTASIGDNEVPGAAGSVNLGSGRTATAVSAGDFHTCALLDDGSVRCWGFGADGRLGYGNTANIGDNEAPGTVGPVALGGRATAISAGDSHTCAVLVGGSVRCWGYGSDGRLGYATADPVTRESETVGDNESPASVGPLELGGPATAISAGSEHTCALLVDRSVRCWGSPGGFTGGDGGDGRLGYANANFIGDDETPSSHALSAVACPSATQCTAVDSAGQQVTFNPTAPGTPTPTTIAPGRTLTAVACPSTTQCTAVDSAGRQVTFNPTAPGTPTPTAVDTGRLLSALACPSTTQCTAVGRAGQQVTFNPAAPGTPTPTTIDAAAPVDLGLGATAISAGDWHSCAVLDGGNVRCWGLSRPGGRVGLGDPNDLQRGIGDHETPASVPPVNLGPGRTATAITAGDHTCARLDNGTVRCWGPGGSGRLGYGNTSDIGDDESPGSVGPVNIGGTATAISAGGAHTCARLANSSIRCWGEGEHGQLGYGNRNDIGDNETPAAAGPVTFGRPASNPPPRPRAPGPTNPPDPDAAGLRTQAARLQGLRTCLAKRRSHSRREIGRARRLTGSRRTRARRHTKRHARRLRSACLRRWGRKPGVVTGLTARAVSKSEVLLTFRAAGTHGSRPPAARSYVVKQSRRPIRSARSFRRSQALCGGSCSFSTIRRVGATITLRVTDLRPRTLYFYSVAARDNVSRRLGARTGSARVRTR